MVCVSGKVSGLQFSANAQFSRVVSGYNTRQEHVTTHTDRRVNQLKQDTYLRHRPTEIGKSAAYDTKITSGVIQQLSDQERVGGKCHGICVQQIAP